MLILDLETVAIDGLDGLTEPATAPAHYKDAQKIADYIAKAEREQTTKAALYPWTARIVALGWQRHDADDVTVRLCPDERAEQAALVDLADAIYDRRLRLVSPIIGFNHRTFDLLVIQARALLLRVAMPVINTDRYRGPHVDLLERLTSFGAIPPRSLHWFARRFGIVVDDAVRGSDIAALVAAGDWDAVRRHCASDVRLTAQLAECLGVLPQKAVSA